MLQAGNEMDSIEIKYHKQHGYFRVKKKVGKLLPHKRN